MSDTYQLDHKIYKPLLCSLCTSDDQPDFTEGRKRKKEFPKLNRMKGIGIFNILNMF